MFEANNFHDIYLHGLNVHSEQYEYENKPRDCWQKEKLFYTFCLTNPVERVVYEPERKANLIFQYAEFLWYLSGSSQLDFISYYAKGIRRFSMDGKTLTGTAYGPKLRGSYFEHPVDQIETVIKMLKAEPDTKRAVLSIFQPQELLDYANNIDVSCTLSIQYMIREDKLVSIVNMRANDMYVGAVSDVFSFTMLQEYIASRLGIKPGAYYHVVGSSHLFEPNWEKAEKLYRQSRSFTDYPFHFPAMSSENIDQDLALVLEHEEKLRNNEEALTAEEIENIPVSSYWRQVIMLLELQREHIYEKQKNQENLEYLCKEFRYFIDLRFQ